MSRRGRFLCLLLNALILQAAGVGEAEAANTAADICSPAADPCNVISKFDIDNNSTLDFGTRSVSVTGSGQFNFAQGSGSILCGNFSASTSGPAIDANGALPSGGTGSGTIVVHARRQCTEGNPEVPCVDLSDCQLGACNTRRCSEASTRTCLSDASCQLGPCGGNRRCAGATGLRCNSNDDCDFGVCPEQLTCANRGADPLDCSTNEDCDFGTCTVGTASISMGGSIVGNSDNPAQVELRAADSVSISKTVNLSSTSAESDGGELLIEAAAGAVVITGKLTSTGGGDSQGGFVDIAAGTDVFVNEEIIVNGGDFDGGLIGIDAGRDITVGRSLFANSTSGGGFGGEILLSAARDIAITGLSSSNKTSLETSGHTDSQGFAGDGGTQEFLADRDLLLDANSRVIGRGSITDGRGSDVFISAGENLVFAGTVTAKADGAGGEGGSLELSSGGTMNVAAGAAFDLTGGASGGGFFVLASDGDLAFAGAVDVSASGGGGGGVATIDVSADANVVGTLTVGGAGSGELEIQACRITLGSSGKLENKVTNGANTLLSRESMKLLSGSTLKSGAAGTNTLIYRTAAKPPVLSGTVSPAATLLLDPTLAGCPVCGNAEIDDGETCDDGNIANGDGCSSLCQNEKCLAQTIAPGYPAVPLCEDGNLCTEDWCNTTQNGGTCRHPAKDCDDSIACTLDTCSAGDGSCGHSVIEGACDDSNPCTDDVCSFQSGCTPVVHSGPCDDGDPCTENDQCIQAQCHGTPIENCSVCGDGVVGPAEACDDGNATFVAGEYCGVGCVLIPCGKPTNSSGTLPKSSDALFILRAAVGDRSCSPRVCDVDSNTKVLASDALRVLKAAVGQNVTIQCPAA